MTPDRDWTHPLDDVARTRLICDRCGHGVSVYTDGTDAAVLCLECGHPMTEAEAVDPDDIEGVTITTCVVCGAHLNDPKNAGDPDANGDYVCYDAGCRAVHDVPMTVERVLMSQERALGGGGN